MLPHALSYFRHRLLHPSKCKSNIFVGLKYHQIAAAFADFKKTDRAQSIDLLKQLQTAVLRHNQKRHFNSFFKTTQNEKHFEANSILCNICFGVAVILCTAFFIQNL
jgi:hypothetical protein